MNGRNSFTDLLEKVMNSQTFCKFVLVALIVGLLTGCGGGSGGGSGSGGNGGGGATNQPFKLTEGSLTLSQSLGNVIFSKDGSNSAPLALDVGFGSGAYHRPGDPNNIFYTVTDRGPNVKCKNTGKVFGINNFCPQGGDKVFPLPEFTPTIYQIELTYDKSNNYSYKIIEKITLKDTKGINITGLTNNLTVTDSEVSIGGGANQLEFDNEGLDTEAIVRMKDSTFWLTDEYAPSLIHVASDGRILKRVVPKSVAADLVDADYPVKGLLPDILKKRKLNRGIESIAVSPDESFLYFIMQSPLANPNKKAYSSSRNVRLFKLALSAGDITSIQGEYVYRIDTAYSFADEMGNGDVGKKQKNVKVSEMLAVKEDDLIILERLSKTTKLYRVDLSTGDNILNTPISSAGVNGDKGNRSLEQVVDLALHNVKAVTKVLTFNTLTDMPEGITAPKKIEGIALLDDEYVLLINDNDFGIGGDSTTAIVLKIAYKFTDGHKQ